MAFGALERVIIAQVKPQPRELLSIERPDYVDVGTVPYLDWGSALSPCFRDKSYPALAVAWGKLLQLAVYVNLGNEPAQVQFDGFYVCEHSIDSVFFLSESVLFVVVNKKEVRVLYTQNLTPGLFDETFVLSDPARPKAVGRLLDPQERTRYFLQLKQQLGASGTASAYAEKDRDYKLL